MINHLPYGSDNMGLEVSATPTPKCPTDTSPNSNIMFNSPLENLKNKSWEVKNGDNIRHQKSFTRHPR